MPVAAPMSCARTVAQCHYKSDEEIVVALADALRRNTRRSSMPGSSCNSIDAFLAHEYDRLRGLMSEREVHKVRRASASISRTMRSPAFPKTRCATTSVGEAGMRPHTPRVPLKTLSDLILKVRAQAYSLESANPRHEHEWMVWKDCQAADGKILIPGYRHPFDQLVSKTSRLGGVVASRTSPASSGRENVIAGT
jgi:5-methyltetrahydropteroyltriglutamate--homocysteine methyltransferase